MTPGAPASPLHTARQPRRRGAAVAWTASLAAHGAVLAGAFALGLSPTDPPAPVMAVDIVMTDGAPGPAIDETREQPVSTGQAAESSNADHPTETTNAVDTTPNLPSPPPAPLLASVDPVISEPLRQARVADPIDTSSEPEPEAAEVRSIKATVAPDLPLERIDDSRPVAFVAPPPRRRPEPPPTAAVRDRRTAPAPRRKPKIPIAIAARDEPADHAKPEIGAVSKTAKPRQVLLTDVGVEKSEFAGGSDLRLASASATTATAHSTAAMGGEARDGGLTLPSPVGGRGNRAPRYPDIAREHGWEGRVILRVHVDPDGRTNTVAVRQSSGHDILDRTALAAVRDWTFNPAQRAGRPVPGTLDVPISFRLQN